MLEPRKPTLESSLRSAHVSVVLDVDRTPVGTGPAGSQTSCAPRGSEPPYPHKRKRSPTVSANLRDVRSTRRDGIQGRGSFRRKEGQRGRTGDTHP